MRLCTINSIKSRQHKALKKEEELKSKEIYDQLILNNEKDDEINKLIDSGYYKSIYAKFRNGPDDGTHLNYIEVITLSKYEFEENIEQFKSDYIEEDYLIEQENKFLIKSLEYIKKTKKRIENEENKKVVSLKIENKITDDKKKSDEALNKMSNHRRNYY